MGINNVSLKWSEKRLSLTLGLAIAVVLVVAPYVYFRYTYIHQKRLRVVVPGLVYRSGCMTANGLEEALQEHRFKTVLNLMQENPDPNLPRSYFNPSSIKESELCQRYGARMVNLIVELVTRPEAGKVEPPSMQQFRAIMDDAANYPILIHCKAGLHRTGVLVAMYRLEYQGWTREQAMLELKQNGFGEYTSNSSNDYIQQYVLLYQPRRVVQESSRRTVPARMVSRTNDPTPE